MPTQSEAGSDTPREHEVTVLRCRGCNRYATFLDFLRAEGAPHRIIPYLCAECSKESK